MTSVLKMMTIAPALVFAGLVFSTPVALAAGSGDSSTTTPSCKKGKMWDKKKKKCVKVKKKSGLTDDNLYEVARDFAYNNRYEDALNVLSLVADQADPRILNYRGYATRKLGRVEEGLTYYQAALAVDPTYTLAREYMGEAFLQLGKVDKALEQLAAISSICGVNCREYTLLEKQIVEYTRNS